MVKILVILLMTVLLIDTLFKCDHYIETNVVAEADEEESESED